MKERKSIAILLGFVLSSALIASSFTAALMNQFHSRAQFRTLGAVCQGIVEKKPEAAQTVSAALKEYKSRPAAQDDSHILYTLGYRQSDFLQPAQKYGAVFAASGFALGAILFLLTFWYRHKREVLRIRSLTDYLEQVNTGKPGLLFQTGEDDFSKLQDEIYKTVTMLYQTRDSALEAKNNFAENLSNIAHQLKTPVTAMSLSAQMMKTRPAVEYSEQIQRQLSRLTHLEEALLLLSRIDAGTLSLEKKSVDVFTVLMLAADNLRELFLQSGVSVHIPELGETEITADLDWTMEALMNLLKNCMEHTPPGGTVHCSYAQNSLYTEIAIWDEGQGFAKEEIPRLFERFYRGRDTSKNGIGIGLSLAKEITERQNGTLRDKNLPSGGACFEVRFYSH